MKESAPPRDRPDTAAHIVQLMFDDRFIPVIEASPQLSHIIEDLAADLEWENGDVEELWPQLTFEVSSYLESPLAS